MVLQFDLFITAIEALISIVIAIVSGVLTAFFTLYYSRKKEKEARIRALGEKLASEIVLFQRSCDVLLSETGRRPDSMGVVRDLALYTAHSIMDAFRLYPEASEGLAWDLLVEYSWKLVHLAVKGWGDADGSKWFLEKVEELKEDADPLVEWL